MEDRYGEFTSLVTNIYKCIESLKSEGMAQFDLKGKQMQCLYMISSVENIKFNDLVNLCGRDKASISRTIKELMDKHLIEHKCEDKKYKNTFVLTNTGEEISRYIKDKIQRILELCTKNIDEKTRDKMYSALRVISSNLTQIYKEKGENIW